MMAVSGTGGSSHNPFMDIAPSERFKISKVEEEEVEAEDTEENGRD